MIQTFSFSDKGPRTENQDFHCLVVLGDQITLAVADGVGGNNGGRIASRLAINKVLSGFYEGQSLSQSLDSAHSEILSKAAENADWQGMATTLTAVTCSGGALNGVHCGDSRAYLLRGQGLKQLTTDHTEVAKLLGEGRITKEEAIDYPRKNILTSALGTSKELIEQEFQCEITAGDRVLLLTDGVYSEISKRQIQELSSAEPDLGDFCGRVLKVLAERGASDNYTIVGVQFS